MGCGYFSKVEACCGYFSKVEACCGYFSKVGDMKAGEFDKDFIEQFLSSSNEDSIWKFFENADENDDGVIDQQEFAQLIFDGLQHFSDKAKAKDDTYCPPELCSMMTYCLAIVENLLEQFDVNKDGKIQKSEFKAVGAFFKKEER